MALTPTTELQAINQMLAAIGESPVNSINSGLVDAVLAKQALDATSTDLQERGWHWNTLKGFTLGRSLGTDEIFLPTTTLKVDTVDTSIDAVQRGSRLFDNTTHSYQWDRDLKVNLVELLPFEELPQAARTFITLSASRRFQQGRLGSDTLYKFQTLDEQKAWASLIDAEAETSDASIFDNYSVSRVLDR